MAADNSRRLAGIASFTIDGVQYQLVGDLTYSCSDRTRETLAGMDTVHGYSEKIVPGFMKAKLRDSSIVDTATFTAMTNSTVIAQTSNGKAVSGYGMWCIEAIEVAAADGTFDVRFEGDSVQESR